MNQQQQTYKPYGGNERQQTHQNTYQQRYQRTPSKALDNIFSAGPYLIALLSFVLTVAALMSLVGMDAITGKFSSTHMLNGDENMGWFFSFGTTGVVLATVGMFMYGMRERWHWSIILMLAIAAAIPVCIDIYFDAMSVDIVRFGQFVDLNSIPTVPIDGVSFYLPAAEILPHKLFRIMVGALSAVGEPLAATAVIIFPVMKELFKGVL